MGSDLSKLWLITSEIKRKVHNHFKTLILQPDYPEWRNEFTPHNSLILIGENEVNGFIHLKFLTTDERLIDGTLHIYNYTFDHFEENMMDQSENFFKDDLKASESSSKKLREMYESIRGLIFNNEGTKYGWTSLCHSESTICIESELILESNFNLIQQTDWEQSYLIGLGLDSHGSIKLNTFTDLPRTVRLKDLTTGILDPENKQRTGETIWMKGSGKNHPLSHKILKSVEAGLFSKSGIREDVFDVEGMSSPSIRHFLSYLMSTFEDKGIRYLEVGVYKGSTLISGMSGNEGRYERVVAVDNFEEFDEGGENFEKLKRNLEGFISEEGRGKLQFLKKSCWEVGEELRGLRGGEGFNVYFYDGPHSEEDHYQSIVEFYEHLAYETVFVVDDYNQQRVRDGTMKGLKHLENENGLEVVEMWEITSRWNGDSFGWWDGLGIFVLRKKETEIDMEVGEEL